MKTNQKTPQENVLEKMSEQVTEYSQMTLVQMAENLAEIREEMDALSMRLKSLKEKEEAIRIAAVEPLRMLPRKEFAIGNMLMSVEVRTGYEIVDEDKAFNWAKKVGILRIDKTQISKMLRGRPMPKCFEFTEKEYIKVSELK